MKNKKVKVPCNYNCFKCKYDDCIVDTMNARERIEQVYRDNMYENYGKPLPRALEKKSRRFSSKPNY